MSLLPDGQLRNLELQYRRAKDLLAAARSGDRDALARIRTHRTAAGPRRVDAQLALADEADAGPRDRAESRPLSALREGPL